MAVLFWAPPFLTFPTPPIMITERLKFYADVSEKTKNKFFCFKINSILDLENRLKYWMSRMYIRAAWYECIEDNKVIDNRKIDLSAYTDFQTVQFLSN
jgi:hypothetical protein